MIGRDFLPSEQEADEVGAGDWLDLLAQTVEGVAVNAGKQAARAPFGFRNTGGEAAADDEAFCFKSEQGCFDVEFRQA